MFIVDGHLDLAMNALRYERDIRLPVAALRRREQGVDDGRGVCTLSLPELRNAGVGLVVSTVLARSKPWIDPARKPPRSNIDYPDATMAYAMARGELAYYRLLEGLGELRVITTAEQLDAHLAALAGCHGSPSPDPGASGGPQPPLGVIVTMEGADPIVDPEQLGHWHELGLRTLMLAHFGQSRYAAGTPSVDPANTHDVDGPITDLGKALLEAMAELAMPLDLSHASDLSFYTALDAFDGRVYSSHASCRAIAPGGVAQQVHPMRMHTDEQLRMLIERGAVIGVPMFNAYLDPNYRPPPDSDPDLVPLSRVADHVDHICQLAGSADHVAIGSDLDGGFGAEHTPRDLDTVADLPRLAPLLKDRGLTDDDVAGFFAGNWMRFWQENLPPGSPGGG